MEKALGFLLVCLAAVEIPVISAIPDDFECAWRSAAYDFGQKLLPRQGSFEALFQALELWNCSTWSMRYDLRRDRVARERQYESNAGWPVDAVMVSANDEGLSLQEACNLASSQGSSKTVVLEEGTHRLESSLVLGPEHSGLRIVGASPSGKSKISGGVELHDLIWTMVANSTWATYVDLAAHNLTEIEGLIINGTRRTVARYPNLPGGIESTCYYGCEAAGASAEWIPPIAYPNSSYYASAKVRNDSASGEFESYQIGVGGSCSIFEPAASYWCSENPQGGGAVRFQVPSGVKLPAGFGNSPYATPPRFHVYRPARWANWMFEAKLTGGNNYTFTRGGFQGARGDTTGGDFHVENVLEELDNDGEYYFDQSESVLYLFAQEPPSANASVVVPKLKVLLNATGTSNHPVLDVVLEKLSFVASRHTYMEPHAVPSGGDWSLERQGAVLVQGAHNFSIRDCAFDRIDTGNAVLVSGYNRNLSIIDCDFTSLAGTAIAIWGFTNETSTDPARPGITLQNAPAAGMDATDGEHPIGTVVRGCLASDIGLIVKQSAFLFQAKAQESVISGNVFFNAPRAGINLNDGMGGGDLISDNLIFNVVRETQDHGVINSWDRQPFLTDHGVYMKQHIAQCTNFVRY